MNGLSCFLILELYDCASNAKVNLSKTVFCDSVWCLTISEWVSIASSADLEWHDSSYVGAVRYLGYPLYSSKAQLDRFLDGVKVKESRLANILGVSGVYLPSWCGYHGGELVCSGRRCGLGHPLVSFSGCMAQRRSIDCTQVSSSYFDRNPVLLVSSAQA